MRNTDLHTHSHYSDGEDSPKELVRKARKLGIKNLALTDHTSVSGVQEAIDEGKKVGVNVIPAVEVIAEEDEVLGYFIDYKNPGLKKDLTRCAYLENEATKRKIQALKKQGFDISYKKLLDKYPHARNNHNGAHLANLIKSLPYLGSDIWECLENIKIKKPSKKDISVVSAIKLIKKYKGVPVLAHPWLNKEVLKEKNFKKYVKAGLKGIEIENGEGKGFGRDRETVARIRKLAKKYNLILTVGSDFHGKFLIELTGAHQFGRYLCDERVVRQLEKLKESL